MTEKKTTTKKSSTTTKKKTTTTKKIKLTYQPLGFSATSINFPLREKDKKGRNQPLIKGLPMNLEVHKGEILEVTQKQFEELQVEGIVETDEEYKERKAFINGMKDQYPKTYSDLEIAELRGDLISATESQRLIYNDKLIRVD
jgi:hypothetical protein